MLLQDSHFYYDDVLSTDIHDLLLPPLEDLFPPVEDDDDAPINDEQTAVPPRPRVIRLVPRIDLCTHMPSDPRCEPLIQNLLGRAPVTTESVRKMARRARDQTFDGFDYRLCLLTLRQLSDVSGMCETTLKRVMRMQGIKWWPRKRLIKLQGLLNDTTGIPDAFVVAAVHDIMTHMYRRTFRLTPTWRELDRLAQYKFRKMHDWKTKKECV